jgi:hypothetical protein
MSQSLQSQCIELQKASEKLGFFVSGVGVSRDCFIVYLADRSQLKSRNKIENFGGIRVDYKYLGKVKFF